MILISGLTIFGFGILLFCYGGDMVTTEPVKYFDNEPIPSVKDEVTIKVPKQMKAPIYVFLELTDFYGNNRLMINSLRRNQLGGKLENNEELHNLDSKLKRACEKGESLYNKDMTKDLASWNDKPLIPGNIASPCGLMAKNFPREKFLKMTKEGTADVIKIESSTASIALEIDTGKFKPIVPEENGDEIQWLDVKDARFINWMKSSTSANFKKLWGRIDVDLEEGNYIVTIEDHKLNMFIQDKRLKEKWPEYGFKKSVFLTTSGSLGATKGLSAILFILCGSFSILTSVVTLLLAMRK